MYPAINGDSFLLKANWPEPVNILIDGGYASTFKKYIYPDLNILASQGHCLDLVVATHIDSDHVGGLIEFFKQNGNSKDPQIIQVKNVLHNSIRSLNSATADKLRNDDLELLNEISLQGYSASAEPVSDQEEISASQGSSLAALLLGGGFKWNGANGSTSIDCYNTPFIQLKEKVHLQLISPQPQRLTELKSWWMRELRRLGFIGNLGESAVFDDAFEFLCSQNNSQSSDTESLNQISASTSCSLSKIYSPDKSVTNSSSIAFIAHVGSAKVLFLGDAWSEDIELQIKKLKTENKPLIFDAIKVSHHGSLHNTSVSLLELIDSSAFFISSNGSLHNHPDLAVLKEIVDRPSEFKRNLYFSHSTLASKKMSNYKSKSGSEFVIHESANNWIELTTELL